MTPAEKAHADGLARMQRLFPSVWRPQSWLWEAITLGAVWAALWVVLLVVVPALAG